MPCYIDLDEGTVRSFWRPSDDDEMIEGNAIFIYVAGSLAAIKVGLVTDELSDMHDVNLEPTDQGGGACAAAFNADTLNHFMNGGYFAIEVNQLPPYPMSVWIDKVPE
jgi:hypothetical protein